MNTHARLSALAIRKSFFFAIALLLLSCGTLGFGQNSTIFGPNVYVFTPSTPIATINSTLATLAENAEFDTRRYAVLFAPGTYSGVESQVGFYESVAGLGETPAATSITNGYLTVNTTDSNGNVTTNFWRSIENMSMSLPTGDVEQWAVSQGAAFRRMNVNDSLELTNTNCGEASGGFLGDSVISGQINSCSQQQWYTRNSNFSSWSGNLWNMTFSGDNGAPAAAWGNGGNNYEVLATTPVVREKPFLYQDASGNYWVFSPALRTNSVGPSWTSTNMGAGTSLPISSFFIATPSSTLTQINAALASGQNLILTPGIYQYSGSINVTNANTVVLGIGYADLIPQSGTAALTVADVDGVQIAGLLIDAGPVNSAVLFEMGNPATASGCGPSHAGNPSSISDVFFRIGGATAGTATTSLQVDSNNAIIDNLWAWRADHGADASWTGNVALHGVVVNGNNVTALGLAVEHFQQNQTVWNGSGGETIFYQSEIPYDVPNQSSWNEAGGNDGYSSYFVSPSALSHKAYGVGVYSYFDQGQVIFDTDGVETPNYNTITINDVVAVYLAGDGGIYHPINGEGATAESGSYISFWPSWTGTQNPPAAASCTAGLTAPGAPTASGTTTTATTLNWAASTDAPGKSVTYSVYRSTISGFAPTGSPAISGLTGTTYTDTNLAASTTYYYVVVASDGTTTADSAQGSVTTVANSCSAVPTLPTGVQAAAVSTSAIAINWSADTPPANCTINSYSLYGSTTSGFTPSTSNQIASGLTGTSYTNSGLAASTTYYYKLEAVDSFGTSSASAQAQATTSTPVATCSAVPSAPTGVTAVASSSSAIGLSWTADTAPSNCTISSYSVYGSTTSGFTPSSSTLLSSSVTGTSYTNTGLTASTKYYYVVEATDADGSSAASAQVSTTTQPPSTGTSIVSINAGGAAVSNSGGGDNSYVADEDYNGAGTYSVTNTITIPSSVSATAAPAGVYQSARQGAVTYTIPNLTAGSSYTVRLHFAELYFSAAGSREFNVAINGTTVLTNFDIYATAKATYTAVVENFTATASSNGQIVIAFTNGAKDQSMINGVEVLGSSSTPPTGDFIAVNAGGATVSNSGGGDASFVADEDYVGGGTYSVTNTITIPASIGTANAAPAAVYQSARQGVVTYTIPGLVSGSSHTVLLHFAELYFSAAGGREFNVAINGTSVLTNFDIYATAKANYTAVVETFTATANSSGQIVIALTNGAVNQPMLNGIEIR